jgi:cytoskeletal protein CcmA (bactofilin family)
LKGSVHAKERIELHPRARVTADLKTPVLRIEEGAYFQGSCDMAAEPASRLVGMPAPLQRK